LKPCLTCRNATVRAGFSRCHSALPASRAPPAPPGAFRRSNPARSPTIRDGAGRCSWWRSTRARASTCRGLADQPTQGDREPAPQVRCPPLPHPDGWRSRSSHRRWAARVHCRPRHAGPDRSGAGRARRSARCLRGGGSGGHRRACRAPVRTRGR